MNLMQNSLVIVRLFQENNACKLIIICRFGDESRSFGLSALDASNLTVSLFSILFDYRFFPIFYINLSFRPTLDMGLFFELLIAFNIIIYNLEISFS